MIPAAPLRPHGSAFTLIELMVAVTIMLILLAITASSVNFALNGDRVRGGARQVQSYLAGARDRAIYAKEVRGVRLLVDPSDPHAVNSMVYVGAPTRYRDGVIQFDATGRFIRNTNTSKSFGTLGIQGLLAVGSPHRIQIPADTGAWYRIVPGASIDDDALRGNGGEYLTLSEPYQPKVDSVRNSITLPDQSYILELLPTQLPNTNPVALPRGVVIDLNGSKVPIGWRPFRATDRYGNRQAMDILFSPRGTMVGDAAGEGLLHLMICQVTDLERWNGLPVTGRDRVTPSYNRNSLPLVIANGVSPNDTLVRGDQILVSVSARTGNIATYQVDPTNEIDNSTLAAPADVLADDPFKFAETGEVTGR